MKRSFPEQIVAKLREADRELGRVLTVKQVCPKIESTEQTCYRWRIARAPSSRPQSVRTRASGTGEPTSRMFRRPGTAR